MTDIPNKKHKIFIVDDDQFLVNMYSMKFQKSGFDIETATGSELALSKLREGMKPDAVLLDVVMPAMDGLELLEVIKREKLAPGGIIIMLTNQGQTADMDKAKKMGADSYIIKANTIPSEVVAEVAKIIEEKQKK